VWKSQQRKSFLPVRQKLSKAQWLELQGVGVQAQQAQVRTYPRREFELLP
jgi:hypothetical protein